jgi:hypothetical protein
MELVRSLGIAVMVITLVVGFHVFHSNRGLAILKKWVARNGFQLLDYRRPFYSGGFSPFSTSRGQVVYSVKVRDASGDERTGWVRCGSFFGGVLFSDEAEVKWENSKLVASL